MKILFRKTLNIVLVAALFAGMILSSTPQSAFAGDQHQEYKPDTATPPLDYVPTPSNSKAGRSVAAPNALGSLVAVFQDVAPWGSTSTQDILTANGISFEMHTSAEFDTIDFNQFPMIVISGDQPQLFYDRYATYQSKFESYVTTGGYLNFFACDMGWNIGNLTAPLPGGVIPGDQYDGTNNIIDPAHPLVAGVPNPFTGNFASHAYFTNLVPGTATIATDTAGNLTLIYYDLGYGTVAAFGQPLEISHAWGWDAGQILINALTLIAAIGDFVWDDVNVDGVQDGGENGINGVLIHLYQDNGNNIPEPGAADGAPIATTVSANLGGDDGYYKFSDYFVAGGYFIEFVVTPGFTISPKDNHPTSDDDLDSDADPVTGLTDVFAVTPGTGDYSRDVGMHGTPTAIIGNRVWEDVSSDGVQDAGENGIDGITVNLFYDNGDNTPNTATDYPIDSTTTVGGIYQFDFLAEGNYFLEIVPPANYVFSPKDNHPTNDDTLDSDANPAGLTDVFFLPDAGVDNTRDAGMVESGTIIVEKQTNPVSADTFTFTGDAAGTIADNGQITVSDLLPGTHTSQETAVAGWVLTSIICNDSNSTGNVGTRTATFQLEPGETVTCVFTNTEGDDFGDLPAAYNLTTFADDGARHTTSTLYLGAAVDDETDGQESADAGRSATSGDDGANTDDEDGVGVVGTWQEGVNGGTVDVVVNGGAGCLSGWVDWASNNNLSDAGDQVLNMVTVSTGTNRLSFDIPAGVLPSQNFYDRFARFRLAPDSGTPGDCSDDTTLALTGLVIGGEVEDHYLRFSRPTGTGPGGVGLSDGNSALELWLKPGSGVYNDAGTTLASPGQTVQQWNDQSGNGNNVDQTTASYQPIYQAGVPAFNGNPTIDFDVDYLDRQPNIMPSSTSDGAVFLVAENASLDGWDTGVGFDNVTSDGDFPLFGTLGVYQHIYAPTNTHPDTLVVNTPYIFSWVWQASVDLDLYTNGNGYDAPNILNSFGMNVLKVGGETSNVEFWDGPIAEIVIFSEGSNDARRVIVENYLQAKYNDSTIDNLTIATDVYDGDTTANGNFDMHVAGIGREVDGDNWTAHSAGLIVQDVSFLQDSGDYLLYGHNIPVNNNTTDDLPTSGDWDGADDLRWARHWYFARTDTGTTGGLVDIFFDYSEGSMNNDPTYYPAEPASNYRLLRRADATGQFEDITSTCVETTSIYGDQVVFRNVDVTCLGSNFTLGTIDADNSPTALNLQTFSTNEETPFLQGTAFLSVAFLALAGLFIWKRRRAS